MVQRQPYKFKSQHHQFPCMIMGKGFNALSLSHLIFRMDIIIVLPPGMVMGIKPIDKWNEYNIRLCLLPTVQPKAVFSQYDILMELTIWVQKKKFIQQILTRTYFRPPLNKAEESLPSQNTNKKPKKMDKVHGNSDSGEFYGGKCSREVCLLGQVPSK